MQVLLIYPPISKEERYSSAIGSAGGRQMLRGVFHLASYLRQRGDQVGVILGMQLLLQAVAGDVQDAPAGPLYIAAFSPNAYWQTTRDFSVSTPREESADNEILFHPQRQAA